jgi:hypothetical protein
MEPESVIHCGFVEDSSGNRIYRKFIDFFGKEVEVFTAEDDPQQRWLFRVSDLAQYLGTTSSRVKCILCF